MSDWESDIRRINDLNAKLYKARDFNGQGDLYTEDCIIFPPGEPPQKGRQAVADCFAGVNASGVDRSVLMCEEVYPCGDTATERGKLMLYNPDGSVAAQGKYMVIWKRVNGEAKLHRDIWSFNSK